MVLVKILVHRSSIRKQTGRRKADGRYLLDLGLCIPITIRRLEQVWDVKPPPGGSEADPEVEREWVVLSIPFRCCLA
jgi:hypothetical protein